jgi:2-(1,2-epoxy-1,2-dihydrophenyl)acetyl-CoA isomerase
LVGSNQTMFGNAGTTMSNDNVVQYEMDGDVAILHLNHPETLNALSSRMGQELLAGLDRASTQARAIVLSSRGRAFSSGANLTEGSIDLNDPQRDMGARLDTIFNPLMKKIRDLPVPFVTAVRGAAAGVGCPLALMGDLIVAGKSAYFLQAFCGIGLVPDGGSAYVLSRAIGRVRAMEMMLLGERYPAEAAFAAGLVSRLVDDEKVDDTAIAIARRLAQGPTRTLAMIRRSAWAALDSNLDTQLDRERQFQREAGRTNDFIEGVAAFREKRKPQFGGT